MQQDRVADLMTRDVMVIGNKSEVHELERLLLEKRVHGLPVVDDDGTLVGVVSQTDLLGWHFNTGIDGAGFYDAPSASGSPGRPEGLHLTDIRTALVEEVMSPVVHCIDSRRPIADAAATMIRHKIHRLVVVGVGMRVEGIISALDVLHGVPGVKRLVGVRRGPRVTPRSSPTVDP